MEKLAPGVYMDDGDLHLDVPELLAFHGYADTPANVNAVIKAAVEALGAAGGGTVIVVEQHRNRTKQEMH